MKTSKMYTNELKKQFGYLATWLPGTPIALGDIGKMDDNVFTKISNLSDLGISFETQQDDTPSDIEHNSQGAVSVSFKAAGSAAPPGSSLGEVDAGISVSFSKENAILFKANGTTSPSIKNQISLGQEILKRYDAGDWDKSWVVVTEVVNANSATILISGSADSKIELKAKGSVEVVKIDIADADLGLETTTSKDLSTKILAEKSLTPLFKVSKVQKKFFKDPGFEISKSIKLPGEKEDVIFGEVEIKSEEETENN